MSTIVAVHGIAQQFKGEQVLASEWTPSLLDGLTRAGANGRVTARDVSYAFYGDLFRPSGTKSADSVSGSMVLTDDENALLNLIWQEAANVEPGRVVNPRADVRGTPAFVQAAVKALTRSSFFVGVAEKIMFGEVRQVLSYLNDSLLRDAILQRVNAAVTTDTRVIFAHSLGTVVAFEALHAFGDSPSWGNVATFITAGSPLGIRNLIFDRLTPKPAGGIGMWPPKIAHWTNIADVGDIVALVKNLNGLFGRKITDIRISNGAHAHDVSPYLTAGETGKAISDALA